MRLIIHILILITCLPAWSQNDRIDSLLNDLLYGDSGPLTAVNKPAHYNFIYSGINFNSNTFYAGREIGTNRYNISGNVYFYSSKGLFFGVSGNYYDEITPGYSTTIMTMGFYKAFDKNKKISFRTSYNRFFYNQPDSVSDYLFKNNISAGLSYREKWFGVRMTENTLFGQDFGITVSAGMYSRITILKFANHNKIYTMPDLSFFAGSETIETERTDTQTGAQTIELKDVYGLLNTQIYIPVCVSLGDFEIEIGCALNVPTTQDSNNNYPVNIYYMVSIGYLFQVF